MAFPAAPAKIFGGQSTPCSGRTFIIHHFPPALGIADKPAAKEDFEHLPPEKFVESIVEKEKHILEIMGEISALLAEEPKA